MKSPICLNRAFLFVQMLLVLIFSGAMMYAGMGTHSLLVIMSGILFIAGLFMLLIELFAVVKKIFSKNNEP